MALRDMHERLYSREQLPPKKEEKKGSPEFTKKTVSAPQPQKEEAPLGPQPKTLPKTSAIGPKAYRRDWKEGVKKRSKKAEELKGVKKKRTRLILIIVGAAVIVGAASTLAYLYIFRERDTFDPADVTVSIDAPDTIASGEEVTFSVSVQNSSNVGLQNANLRFQKPEGFTVIGGESMASQFEIQEFETVAAGEVRVLTFTGRLIGERNSIKTASATLSYSPENFPGSTFEASDEFDVTIASVPISLSTSVQNEVASGDTVVFTISYTNNSDTPFENMILDVEYPEGFVFESASLQASARQQVWELGTLQRTAQPQQIEIRGKLSGNPGDSRVFATRIFTRVNGAEVVYAEDKAVIKIAEAPFSIVQTAEGQKEVVANLGEDLEYIVTFENTSNIALSRAIVTVDLVSRALDLTLLDIENGSYNAETGTITWDASGVPELANLNPGESGTVRFKVTIIDRLDIQSAEDKNYTVKTIARIDSPDVPQPVGENKIVASNELDVKINSRLIVQAKGYYQDPSGHTNTGPIPPQVGQKTTYTIHWQVVNVNNAVKNAVVSGVLPTGVSFEGQLSLTGGQNLRYDDRTGQIMWDLGDLSAHTGVRLPTQEAIFQISITPSPDQIDQTVPLTASDAAAAITGIDVFTEQELSSFAKELTTDLRDDPSIGPFGARVVESGG